MPALALVVLTLLAVCIPTSGVKFSTIPPIVGYYFRHQDIYFIPFVIGACLLVPSPATLPVRPLPLSTSRIWPIAIALLVLVCWAGHRLVFDGYYLSRDEAMANFDAYIFAHGRLTWPVAPQWKPYAPALNQVFILPIGNHDAWVSAYLPINAAFRAALEKIGAASLTSPLFVALGALALWRIARRLWPTSPSSQLVALALYIASSQILIAGMTAYAMSAHLGLNLLWLWLFLRGGKLGHAGAIAVGFLATGLHQPLFHPLFVAPILFELVWFQRRWRLLGFYAVAYAVICLFWLSWPDWMAHGFSAKHERSGVDFVSRLLYTIEWFDLSTLWVMARNLLRFATWQHLLLLPLITLGITGGRRDPLIRALAVGLVLPVVAMAFLLPVQGHGWGYRYLHGVLGNACLIGAYGWHWLETHGLSYRRAFLATSAASLLVAFPVHAAMVHTTVAPYARPAAAIAAIDADIVIIEDRAALWSGDLALNDPDLRNRPIRLAGSRLDPRSIPALCKGRTIAFFDAPRLQAITDLFGRGPELGPSGQTELKAAAHEAHCTIVDVTPQRDSTHQ